MVTRVRSLALLASALIVSMWAAIVMPASEPNTLLAVGAAAMVALAVVAARTAPTPLGRLAVHTGPPVSAQRRRRGSFLRQSNPDTPGRARPRAPGGSR